MRTRVYGDLKEIVHYDVIRDRFGIIKNGTGLLAYFQDGTFYHIHSDELTRLERWILTVLKEK